MLLFYYIVTGDPTLFQWITTRMLSWMASVKFNWSHNGKSHEQGQETNREKNDSEEDQSNQNKPYTWMILSNKKCNKTSWLRIRDLVLSYDISLLHRYSDDVYKIRFGQVLSFFVLQMLH